MPKKGSVKRATIKAMKSLGTHKPEYNRIVDVFAGLVSQYYELNEQFENSGYQYEAVTADGGVKKAPIVATLETLRKDILAYSDRLCLNPKSLETVTAETITKSKLASVLSGFDKT